MNVFPRMFFWTAACLSLMISACTSEKAIFPVPGNPLIGAKIYDHPGPYEDLFLECKDLGINTLFVSETLAKADGFVDLAHAAEIPIFVIFPVFHNPEALKENPGLAAIMSEGVAAREDWVEFICPSREDYKKSRMEQLRDLVTLCAPDGISLDFIRFFVFWEMVGSERPVESLPQTCFCPVCLQRFETEMSVRIPDELSATDAKAKWILGNHLADWSEWKCRVIAEAVESLAGEARQADPRIMINLHAVPWRQGDFGGAVRSVAGQDLARLAPFLDFVSPMCYHHMVRRPPAWIRDVVVDISARTDRPIIPSIQVSEAYIEEALTPSEFRAALKIALEAPSRGVVFWSWEALAGSPQKMEIARSLLRPAGHHIADKNSGRLRGSESVRRRYPNGKESGKLKINPR